MRRKVLLLFILALVTLVIVGWLGRNAINRSIQSVEEASLPNEKLLLIREMFQDLLDAESSVRTYTITDDRNALNSFGEAATNVDNKLGRLKSITLNETQHMVLDSLDSLVGTKFETLKDLIRIKDADNDSSVLDKIRADIALLRKKEVPEQLSTIRDLYLNEENTDRDYERLFGDSRENTSDSIFDGSVKQDLSSKQLDEVLTELGRREDENSRRRRQQELRLTRFDSRLMDEIRSSVDRYEALEARIVKNQTEQLKDASQNAKTFITTIMVAGLILFAVMLLIIFNDIAQSIRNREKLRAAKEEAERLARVKEEFLSNMSHEIRTPLNAVIGFTEQLEESSLSSKQLGFVERIQRSGKHLQQLINDILDYAKLESGKVALEKIGFQPEKHLRETMELFEKQAADKGLELVTEVEENIPAILIGDPVRYSQVVINLVSNALKFTSKGSVSVSLRANQLAGSRVTLVLEVADSGIGIPQEKLQHIFEDFAQADSSTTREYGGTGLGLSIVRKIVKAQNGQLDVHSEEGRGTTFTISIPYTTGTMEDLPKNIIHHGAPYIQGKRILIVDDQEFNRELVETILRKTGAEPTTCSNGLDAVERLKSNPADLVLMDIQMPGLSGLDATKQIRAHDGTNQEIPIIALTAGSSDKEKEAIRAAGMNDVLLKPFSQADLMQMLGKYLGEPNTRHVPGPDLTDLRNLSNGDDAFIIQMLEIFINNNRNDFSALEEACSLFDFAKIKSLSHKMIPPCRHLGFNGVVDQLRKLESAAITEDRDAIRQAISILSADLALLYPEIEKELLKLTNQQASSSL